MERRKLPKSEQVKQTINEKKPKQVLTPDMFISSGSTMLNLALSNLVDGGWRKGRVVNIVGDESTGKTLLAIESMLYASKVMRKKEKIKLIYNEAENAFDEYYAEMIGLKEKEYDRRNYRLVEEWYEDMKKSIGKNDYNSMLYILDSLDTLETIQDSKEKFDEGTYGMSKAKQMNKLFKRIIGGMSDKVQDTSSLMMILSQTRDKIGVTFGEKKTRAGGVALNFFATQIVWLHIKEKIPKANKVIGIRIKARVKKNKTWKPWREVEFPILFEYGIDDVGSMVDYLVEQKIIEKKSTGRLLYKDKQYHREDLIMEFEDYQDELKQLVKDVWDESERKAAVIRKPKYT